MLGVASFTQIMQTIKEQLDYISMNSQIIRLKRLGLIDSRISDVFKNKLSKEEKLDFLEYLAFQMKSEMSFEKSLLRYTENSVRKSIF